METCSWLPAREYRAVPARRTAKNIFAIEPVYSTVLPGNEVPKCDIYTPAGVSFSRKRIKGGDKSQVIPKNYSKCGETGQEKHLSNVNKIKASLHGRR
jgi:hypothetical protein